MKENLFLVTVKSNDTEYFHIQASTISDAIKRAYDYLNSSNRHPGVSYEITEIKYIGKIAIPNYSLAG